ncbi:MAG TPA: aldehyde dehydrogenase family protein [Verrucomicrobiae bacterium]|nr:aldehyde dehydrogenase family protein [Verrucomicrobiae bacterium]
MNAVLKEPHSIPALFQRLADKAPVISLTNAETRVAKLQRLLDATLAARPQIIEAVQKELGCHQNDIDGQLLMVKGECEFAIRNLAQWMAPEPVQPSLMTIGKHSYIRYEPKGVVLNLATWNAPIAIGLVPLIGAIAAGCTMVLKPSELAPHCSKLLVDIVARTFAPDEFAVVEGGPEVAQELLRQPFNHIFYIGGHAVGRLVMKAAAEHFASVTLEMGGKNPVIVGASADLEDAAQKIGWGRVANAGQVCLAPDYALVQDSVATAFVDALGRRLNAMYNADGKGFDKSPELARIVNVRHFQRIKGLLDDAIARGAKVESGGQTDEASRFIAPTVLTNCRPEMRIMQEEIFGPILCVVPFRDRDEAVREFRRHLKPLASYIFSKDRSEIDWFLAHTTSGSTVVNHNVIQSGTNTWLPFGGVNASGIGRLGGRYTFLECSNARAVVEDGKGLGDPNLMFPPYSPKYAQALDWMLNKGVNMPAGMLRAMNAIVRTLKT